MTKNVVIPVEHLKQAKDTNQQLKVSLGQDFNYDGYEKLLKESAITHDSKLRVQSSRVERRVMIMIWSVRYLRKLGSHWV